MSETCFACGGSFAAAPGGATHAYMLSSPGCWAAYGEVLTREYSDAGLFQAVHRLTVDAYALQHPGDPSDRRAVQSFWLHGASLWMVLRLGQPQESATQALGRLSRLSFDDRPTGEVRFASTHADLLAGPIGEHAARAQMWARASLDAWQEAHGEFDRLARWALGEKETL